MPEEKTAPPDTPPTPQQENRFFAWMRKLDVPRRPGWIGGVCAGIAARLGIDVVIVRGIAVVIAVLGGPAFLLYAAAWLLLPDLEGGIHLERLLRGTVDRAIAGIVGIFVLGLLPFSQGFWYVGAGYWGDTSVGGAIGRALWTLVLIGLGIAFVVWLARRAGRADSTTTTTGPATTDDRPETIPSAPAGSAVAAKPARRGKTDPGPTAPPEPASNASADEVAAWRERQTAWKQEHEAWKLQQRASDRELMLQRAAEAQARSAAEAAARAERRRRRRLANPRMSGAAVAISLGAALIAAGVFAVLAGAASAWKDYEVTVGFAAASIVIGLSIIVAGALKRRSGFLGFIAVLLLLGTLLTAFLPRDRQLVALSDGVPVTLSGRFAQTVGSFSISGENRTAQPGAVIDLWQGAGSVYIDVPDGMTVRVETTQRKGSVSATAVRSLDDGTSVTYSARMPPTLRHDGEKTYIETYGSGDRPDTVIRIWQGAGSVQVENGNLIKGDAE